MIELFGYILFVFSMFTMLSVGTHVTTIPINSDDTERFAAETRRKIFSTQRSK